MITPHDIPGIGHDLFRRGGGIGYPGLRALEEIAEHGPATATALAARINHKTDTIRRSLNALGGAGLVRRGTDGTWSICSDHWDEAAAAVGTAGKTERQRQHHAKEQEQRSAAVAAWKNTQDQALSLGKGPP